MNGEERKEINEFWEAVEGKESERHVPIKNEGAESEVSRLKEDLKRLEERIENIEEYLNRRRRGILFSPRK